MDEARKERKTRMQTYRDSEGNKAGPPTPAILQGIDFTNRLCL